MRLELRWFEAITALEALRPRLPAAWRASAQRTWTVELGDPGRNKIHAIKQVRGITGFSLHPAKAIVDDATRGPPRVVITGDLPRACCALAWLREVDGLVARMFESPETADDDARLRWADSYGDDPHRAFLRAELTATRAAQRLVELSRTLDAPWLVAVGRCWAVSLTADPDASEDVFTPLYGMLAQAEAPWDERGLLGRLPAYAIDGVRRADADAVLQALAHHPGVRADVVRSPSRLAWLLGMERRYGASALGR